MNKKILWMLAAIRPLVLIIAFCGASVLTSCSNDDDPVTPPTPTDEVEAQLQQMTLREKVGQMFYVRPEALDPTLHWTTSAELVAITEQYTSAEAAVGSILAGVDIVLGPLNLVEAFEAVVKAVEDGVLTEQRIDQSVRRILKLKKQRS